MCHQATGISRIRDGQLVTSVVCDVCHQETEFSREPYRPNLIPGIVTQTQVESLLSAPETGLKA